VAYRRSHATLTEVLGVVIGSDAAPDSMQDGRGVELLAVDVPGVVVLAQSGS
jgi:hypothetical protein